MIKFFRELGWLLVPLLVVLILRVWWIRPAQFVDCPVGSGCDMASKLGG